MSRIRRRNRHFGIMFANTLDPPPEISSIAKSNWYDLFASPTGAVDNAAPVDKWKTPPGRRAGNAANATRGGVSHFPTVAWKTLRVFHIAHSALLLLIY